jgi:hypothetical protein
LFSICFVEAQEYMRQENKLESKQAREMNANQNVSSLALGCLVEEPGGKSKGKSKSKE